MNADLHSVNKIPISRCQVHDFIIEHEVVECIRIYVYVCVYFNQTCLSFDLLLREINQFIISACSVPSVKFPHHFRFLNLCIFFYIFLHSYR